MAKNEYSQYQKAVISGYYNNLDTIMLHKLGELVTELYLADTGACHRNFSQIIAGCGAKASKKALIMPIT